MTPAGSFLGISWWLWAGVILVVLIVAVLVRNAAARASKREETERLAQKADAVHEGAQTRHEGGP